MTVHVLTLSLGRLKFYAGFSKQRFEIGVNWTPTYMSRWGLSAN